MAFQVLPPAGRKIVTEKVVFDRSLASKSGYDFFPFDTGKSALSASLMMLKNSPAFHSRRRRVAIPGYCCPDLVSAIELAGFEALAIDIGSEDPGFSLTALTAHIGECYALIAVDFLGISENLPALYKIANDHDVLVIEDRAMAFPTGSLDSDVVVTSFGRGKSINLMGGGGLWIRKDLTYQKLTFPQKTQSDFHWSLQAKLFNLARQKSAYGLISRLPFTNIGETLYEPSPPISEMSNVKQEYLDANIANYISEQGAVNTNYKSNLGEIPGLRLLDRTLEDRCGRLLRYPVVFDNPAQRDRAHRQLNRRGLGASIMYGHAINRIAPINDTGELENATHFSKRLLTFPTHDQVTLSNEKEIVEIVKQAVGV